MVKMIVKIIIYFVSAFFNKEEIVCQGDGIHHLRKSLKNGEKNNYLNVLENRKKAAVNNI